LNVHDKRLDNLDQVVGSLGAGLVELENKALSGIAISNSMTVLLPDPGKDFRLNIGGGWYAGREAIGITGAGRLTENTAVFLGIGTDTHKTQYGGKVGVSFQW